MIPFHDKRKQTDKLILLCRSSRVHEIGRGVRLHGRACADEVRVTVHVVDASDTGPKFCVGVNERLKCPDVKFSVFLVRVAVV